MCWIYMLGHIYMLGKIFEKYRYICWVYMLGNISLYRHQYFTTDHVNFVFVMAKIIDVINNLYPVCRNLGMGTLTSPNRF